MYPKTGETVAMRAQVSNTGFRQSDGGLAFQVPMAIATPPETMAITIVSRNRLPTSQPKRGLSAITSAVVINTAAITVKPAVAQNSHGRRTASCGASGMASY
jgi:hypothetical protein